MIMDLNFRNHDGIQHFIKKGYMLQDRNEKDYYAPNYVLIRNDYNHFAPVVDSQGYDTGADPSRDYGSRYPQKVGFSTVFTQPYTHDLEDIMESDADYAEGIRIDYYTGTLTFYEIGYFNDGSKGREVPLYEYEWSNIDSDWYGAETFEAEVFNADVKMNDRAWVSYYEYDFMNVRPENPQNITGDSKMVSFRDYRKELYGVYLTTQEAKKAFNLLKGSLMGHGDWKDGQYQQVINGYKQIYGGSKTIPVEMQFQYVPIRRFGYDTAMHTKTKNAETQEYEDYNDTLYIMTIYTKSDGRIKIKEWETQDMNLKPFEKRVIKEFKELVHEADGNYADDLITATLQRLSYADYTKEKRSISSKTIANYIHFDDDIMSRDEPHGFEVFNVEFNEWADQEMMSHGKDISFKDWAEDEGMKHGDVPITDWAQHEEESHDARYGAETFEAENSGFDPVVLCKTCGYETSIMEWPRGKNKYTCNCEYMGDIVVICKTCKKETTYNSYDYGYCGCARSKNAESFEAEEGDDCPSCANACKHDNTERIKVESIYDYEVQSPSNMVIQVTCLDCGESGTFYADDVDWHGEKAKLRYSPQIAVNMMNPTYGDLRCSRCLERFQMAAETFSKDKVVCIKCGIPSGFPHPLHELPQQVAGKYKYTCRNCYDEVRSDYFGAESFEAESRQNSRIQNLIDDLYDDREIALNKLLKINNPSLQNLISKNAILRDKVGDMTMAEWSQVQNQLKYTLSGRIRTFGAEYMAERKKRSGLLSEPFEGTSLDSGDWKDIIVGFGIGLLGLFGYSKLRK